MAKIFNEYPEEINSPLTGKPSCVLLEKFPCDKIINGYSQSFNIDVSHFFQGLDFIELLECDETKYRFYYPFSISGDSSFYEHFQHFKWYYMPWKWEHEKALNYITKRDKIIEIGCGAGGFIKRLSDNGYDITGLELNENVCLNCQENGLNVINELVEVHAEKFPEAYDVVCSFQVLEHISDVRSFIASCIRCLRPGGKLLICVPNNLSFIKYEKFPLLNRPPHHMGLWDARSLESIKELFSLDHVRLLYEPLQNYHYEWYKNIIEERRVFKRKFIRYLYFRLGLNKVTLKIIRLLSPFIKGHSIMAVYTKKN